MFVFQALNFIFLKEVKSTLLCNLIVKQGGEVIAELFLASYLKTSYFSANETVKIKY